MSDAAPTVISTPAISGRSISVSGPTSFACALFRKSVLLASFADHDEEDSTISDKATVLAESTMVGRYKILQQIGEGGFGIVYMAEQQEPVKRKVALKVVKAGMDTKEVIARFEAERQALAMMDHPCIAKVHDGAIASGEGFDSF